MPTYHYRCTHCDQHVEVVQRMSDEPIRTCAACGGSLQKVLRPVGIILKGAGFYRTDSRAAGSSRTKGETASGGDKAESASGGDKGETGAKSAPPPSSARSEATSATA